MKWQNVIAPYSWFDFYNLLGLTCEGISIPKLAYLSNNIWKADKTRLGAKKRNTDIIQAGQ